MLPFPGPPEWALTPAERAQQPAPAVPLPRQGGLRLDAPARVCHRPDRRRPPPRVPWRRDHRVPGADEEQLPDQHVGVLEEVRVAQGPRGPARRPTGPEGAGERRVTESGAEGRRAARSADSVGRPPATRAVSAAHGRRGVEAS